MESIFSNRPEAELEGQEEFDFRGQSLPEMPVIWLASRSPRRRELLEQLGLSYTLCDVEIDESSQGYHQPEQYVQAMAERKAEAAFATYSQDLKKIAEAGGALPLLLAADTALSFQGEIMGKPQAYSDFQRMMRKLSGREHDVHSALTLIRIESQKGKLYPYKVSKLSSSQVEFSKLSERFIEEYWAQGEPKDKAGGYAIQGMMAGFIKKICGSYSGIMGLPLFELREALEESGFPFSPQ